MASVFLFVVAFIAIYNPMVQGETIDITSCIQQNWVQCGVNLGTAIFNLHAWSDDLPYKVGPYDCNVQYKGRIHKLKWVWDGKFKCPALSEYESESRGWKSRTGAAEHAMQEYFQNIHLTPEQLEQIKNIV